MLRYTPRTAASCFRNVARTFSGGLRVKKKRKELKSARGTEININVFRFEEVKEAKETEDENNNREDGSREKNRSKVE